MTPKRIIVGFDLSVGARTAARWALGEAECTGVPVEFFHAFERPPDRTERATHDGLCAAVASARREHPDLRITLRGDEAGAALALTGRSYGAALIVLGRRGRSGVRDLLGSVTLAVTTHAHCPVVVAHGRPHDAAPVVVGVDDSPAALAALAFAARQAASRSVVLRVVRAWKPAGTPGPVPAADRCAFDEMIAAWRRRYPGLTIRGEAVVAHPAAVLTAASGTAQLLVVGTHGRGPLCRAALGSVSQHLLHHGACGIAVVPETD